VIGAQLARSRFPQADAKLVESVAQTKKPELTLKERIVGKWDLGGVTHIIEQNGTYKAMERYKP